VLHGPAMPVQYRRPRSSREPGCSIRRAAPEHHDRLLTMLEDPKELLSFFELAVTWGELDYSGESLVPPTCWGAVVDTHVWSDP
jgi:hypothetical protein